MSSFKPETYKEIRAWPTGSSKDNDICVGDVRLVKKLLGIRRSVTPPFGAVSYLAEDFECQIRVQSMKRWTTYS